MEIRGQFFTMRSGPTDVKVLKKLIDIAAESGMNMVCLEVEKALQYKSHPEISAPWALKKEILQDIVSHARERSLAVVPIEPFFSHCNYILDMHPEFRELKSSSRVYCTSCPDLYPFVFDILEEIIEIFQPKYVCIGHDEAISSYDSRERKSIIGCPHCRNKEPYQIFRDDIIRLHNYLAKKNIKLTMWADMFLNPEDFSESSFAQSGCYGGPPDNLHLALDEIPRDIIMWDWHYEPAREYPTIRYLQDKGFETIGVSEFEVNSYLFTRYAINHRTERFRGMLAAAWCLINQANYRVLKHLIQRHGSFFSSPEIAFKKDPLLKKINRVCSEWDEPVDAGNFHKIYDFRIDGIGTFHSLGWRDFRYIEYPEAAKRLVGPRFPRAMELKAGRAGEIKYELRAKTGMSFQEVHLRVWFECLGHNSIQVSSPRLSRYITVSHDERLQGKKINITKLVRGNNSFRIKFAAENKRGKRIPVLKRFEITGRTV